MSDLQFFLAHYYDESTNQFVPFAYTNVAENVYLNIDTEETVADAILKLNQQANTPITSDMIANGSITAVQLAQAVRDDINSRALGNHTHTAAQVGAAPTTHNHDASNINAGTLPIARIPTGTASNQVALGNHAHTAAQVGAAPATHTHTPAQAGAAPATHNHNATNINAGTLALARIPTGTTATTVALGNHTHTAAQLGVGIRGVQFGSGSVTDGFTRSSTVIHSSVNISRSFILLIAHAGTVITSRTATSFTLSHPTVVQFSWQLVEFN